MYSSSPGYNNMDRNYSGTSSNSVVTQQPYQSKIPLPSAYSNQFTEPIHNKIKNEYSGYSGYSGYGTDQSNTQLSGFDALSSNKLTIGQKRERLLAALHHNQKKLRPWKSGLCKCHKNTKHCLLQLALGPIYQGCQAERVGEDFFTGCCMGSIFGLPISCLPCLGMSVMISIRSKVRERHNIVGAICDDWVLYLCCLGNCASCQLYRELDELGYPPSLL